MLDTILTHLPKTAQFSTYSEKLRARPPGSSARLAKTGGAGSECLSLKEKVARDQGMDILNSIIRNKKQSLAQEELFKEHAMQALVEGKQRTPPLKDDKQDPVR